MVETKWGDHRFIPQNINLFTNAKIFPTVKSPIEDIVFFSLWAELQLCAHSLYSSQNTVWPNFGQNALNNEEYWSYILSVASQILDFTPASLVCALFFKWLINVILYSWHYTGTSATIFGLESIIEWVGAVWWFWTTFKNGKCTTHWCHT
jgi:hypothetical protein